MTMTTFGVISLYCALRGGVAAGQRFWLFLSGLCLGFSFALKLWLCGPLGLAVVVALVMRSRQAGIELRRLMPCLGIFAIGFLIPAGLHLMAIAWFYPQDLGFWLKNIYFGIFTGAGISGTKLGGGGVPAEWIHPFWYYGAALYRDFFFLFPIILLGLVSSLRDKSLKRELVGSIFAGIAGLAPLSLVKVKEPLYVLTCAIFLFILAGLCLSALVRLVESGNDIDPVSSKLGTAVILWLFGLFPFG